MEYRLFAIGCKISKNNVKIGKFENVEIEKKVLSLFVLQNSILIQFKSNNFHISTFSNFHIAYLHISQFSH